MMRTSGYRARVRLPANVAALEGEALHGRDETDVGLASTRDQELLAGGRTFHVPAEQPAEVVCPNRVAAVAISGARGIRTPDLCHAMAALSQLSYGPRKLVVG